MRIQVRHKFDNIYKRPFQNVLGLVLNIYYSELELLSSDPMTVYPIQNQVPLSSWLLQLKLCLF